MLHMARIGVRELRLNASRYIERVEAGETIEITKRGRVVGLLTPAKPDGDPREYLIATGQLIPGHGDIRRHVPAKSKRSASAVLAELRESEQF